METGLGLVANERYEKQILKHGFTGEHHALHPEWYANRQLIEAATLLTMQDLRQNTWFHENWDKEWFSNLCSRPHKERLIIAAALICAELDRIIWLENN